MRIQVKNKAKFTDMNSVRPDLLEKITNDRQKGNRREFIVQWTRVKLSPSDGTEVSAI
jgi:hypothetical protein